MTDAKKQEERVKAQQYAELMNEPFVDPYPELDTPSGPPPPPNQLNDELSDEQLVELLKKRGATISSLEDLKPKPTPEELAEKEREKQGAMLAHGLSTGKFKKEEYDAYQRAQSNKIAVIREDIAEQFQAAFPELSPEAIEEKVANYMFENLGPDDAVRQAREKELLTLADMKISDKYKNIVSLPKDYEMHLEGLNKQANFEKKVQATLPVFKADVSKALESLRKFTVSVPDSKNPENTVNLELEYSDADLKEVESLFITNDQIIRAVNGMTFDQLKGEAELVLVKKHLPRLISQAAKNYNAIQKDKYINGRKGLITGNDHLPVHDDKLNDTLEEVYSELISKKKKK